MEPSQGTAAEGAGGGKGIVVYEVNEVYIYIPAELSAAGFELRIAGGVSITDKQESYYLQWIPSEITSQDVLSLYSSSPTSSSTRHAPPFTAAFPLSDIHLVCESNDERRSLVFFLSDGKELPPLHFHDGGTSGLLKALQRYTSLVNHPDDPTLMVRGDLAVVTAAQNSSSSHGFPGAAIPLSVAKTLAKAFTKSPHLVTGLTRAVKQRLLADKTAVEVGREEEGEEGARELQGTVVTAEHLRPLPTPPRPPPVLDVEASLFADPRIITDTRTRLPPRLLTHPREPPLSKAEWKRMRDREGRISPRNKEKIKSRVFYGGIDPNMRREAWKYLLNYFPYEMSDSERMKLRNKKERLYQRMKQQWRSFTEDQEERFSKWSDYKSLINRDVLRTDRELPMFQDPESPKLTQLEDILRTYVMYNFDLGYVQGMSDLLAPLLAVMDNEVDSFWCFAGLMDMVKHHFEESQNSMKIRMKQLRAILKIIDPELYQSLDDRESKSLYCCFRWLLVSFKREFSYDDTMTIWEVIWTRYLSSDFSLFIALAILLREKESIMHRTNDLSEVVQHINRLSEKIPVPPVLEFAEVLCRQLGGCSSLPDDLQTLVTRPMPNRPN